MRNLILIVCLSAALLSARQLAAQEKNPCLDEVLSYEDMNRPANDSPETGPTRFFSYSIRATNWSDETSLSNVKLYKNGNNINLFSEQALVYMDEKNMLIVMPVQKVAILNTLNDQLKKPGLDGDFYELRKTFLSNCEVSRCETKDQNHRTLVLKAGKHTKDLGFSVESMIYEYDPQAKKILSVKVNYSRQYKLRQLVMVYKEYDPACSYTFKPALSHFINGKGKVRETLKGFEIIDNRDKKNLKEKS